MFCFRRDGDIGALLLRLLSEVARRPAAIAGPPVSRAAIQLATPMDAPVGVALVSVWAVRSWQGFARKLWRLRFNRGCFGRLGHWLCIIEAGGRFQIIRTWTLVAESSARTWILFARTLERPAFKRRRWANLGHMLRDIRSRERLGTTRSR